MGWWVLARALEDTFGLSWDEMVGELLVDRVGGLIVEFPQQTGWWRREGQRAAIDPVLVPAPWADQVLFELSGLAGDLFVSGMGAWGPARALGCLYEELLSSYKLRSTRLGIRYETLQRFVAPPRCDCCERRPGNGLGFSTGRYHLGPNWSERVFGNIGGEFVQSVLDPLQQIILVVGVAPRSVGDGRGTAALIESLSTIVTEG